MAKELSRWLQPLLQRASPKLRLGFCGTPSLSIHMEGRVFSSSPREYWHEKAAEWISSLPDRIVDEKNGGKVEGRVFSSSAREHWHEKVAEGSSSPPDRVVDENNGGKLEESASQVEEEDDVGCVNKKIREINGPKGPEPTRYGDWERKGRCSDF